MRPVAALVFLLLIGLVGSSTAHAETCNITGTVQIQSMDSFYCDTGVLGSAPCDNWVEKNLDSEARRMRFMRMTAHHPVTGQLLDTTATDANGSYTLTFDLPQCQGTDIIVSEFFVRVHESDTQSQTPRVRFKMTGITGTAPHVRQQTVSLFGWITPHSITYARATSTPGLWERVANVYYTANSALTAMLTWHADIDAYFVRSALATDQFLIRYNPLHSFGYSGIADPANRVFRISWFAYGLGDVIRHETGHIIHYIAHRGLKTGGCGSYKFGDDNTGSFGSHGAESCEWGQSATSEALATFFGIRSIVTSDDANVWSCTCHNPADPDVCSGTVAAMATETDAFIGCPGSAGAIAGIADIYGTANRCMRVRHDQFCRTCVGTSCTNCTDTNPPDGICDDMITLGFRSEMNVVRWLWDMIDGHGEGGVDDTNRSVGGVIIELLSMPCSSPGSDNDCNEASPSTCVPLSEIGDIPADSRGTRDAYNVRDLNELINNAASGELVNNCVSSADD